MSEQTQARTMTITLPEGYTEPDYIVLVTVKDTRASWSRGRPKWSYAATVLGDDGTQVEEVGEGSALHALMSDVATVIRKTLTRLS